MLSTSCDVEKKQTPFQGKIIQSINKKSNQWIIFMGKEWST